MARCVQHPPMYLVSHMQCNACANKNSEWTDACALQPWQGWKQFGDLSLHNMSEHLKNGPKWPKDYVVWLQTASNQEWATSWPTWLEIQFQGT